MTCSKIFLGDLPELTEEIIQYFRKDFSTLYSCILVNRLWCRLAIPLLWEDPFSKEYLKNHHFIEIYLSKLNEDVKIKLYEYGVNNNLISSNTLFNYPSFIKCLGIHRILSSIQTWVDTVVGKNQERLVSLIYRSLLEMFIENEGNLHSFEVVLSTRYNFFNNSIDLILQNPNFTYHIRNLELRIINHIFSCQNIIKLLKFLYSNCNSILSMILYFPSSLLYNLDRSVIEKYLTQIIISQQNLKKISFERSTSLYNPFLLLKNSNCSNTLNTIIFHHIYFENIVSILQEAFDQLNVLESIHLIYCYSLNSDFVQQIIKVNKPFKLKSLFIDEIIHIESLPLLLEKFGDCLENFGFEPMKDRNNEQKRQLFKLIMEYCKNIRYFDSGIPYDNNIYLFIENNQHNINYLTIESDVFEDHYYFSFNHDELSSTVLQNLGQVLPPKLEYLCLSLSFNIRDLEIFLKNSQNTFINKLLIAHGFCNILFPIKKYIIEKERVKYLAMTTARDYEIDELFFLKDKVNEFKLHNIIVKKFSDLYLSPYSFINDFNK